MGLKTAARLTVALGLLSLLAVGVGHLALTDIAHGERDVSLEWTVLRICVAVIVLFQVATLLTLRKVLRG